MHLLPHILCTKKTVLALEVKFYLDVHWVYMAMATNIDQLNWRLRHISVASRVHTCPSPSSFARLVKLHFGTVLDRTWRHVTYCSSESRWRAGTRAGSLPPLSRLLWRDTLQNWTESTESTPAHWLYSTGERWTSGIRIRRGRTPRALERPLINTQSLTFRRAAALTTVAFTQLRVQSIEQFNRTLWSVTRPQCTVECSYWDNHEKVSAHLFWFRVWSGVTCETHSQTAIELATVFSTGQFHDCIWTYIFPVLLDIRFAYGSYKTTAPALE